GMKPIFDDIVRKIYKGEIASAELCKKAQNEYLLEQTENAAMGNVFISNGIAFGHKTGNLFASPPYGTDARHDSGIVYLEKKAFIVSVTMQLRENIANPIHQQIAQIVIDSLCK
ncbi:MAG: class A beta-lactamase-related serine hydrolase, partial [Coriobacteriales bacterium]|nr:class A beta-lactamase-related serine hydrolase [Coriobacteriales bacterium]